VEHYFSRVPAVPSQEREVRFTVLGREFACTTDSGVFSADALDEGTRLLIEGARVREGGRILDLGAGWGPVGVALGTVAACEVWAVESNARAAALCERNLDRGNVPQRVLGGDGLGPVEGETFDAVLLNPPIRAGKAVYYPWLQGSRRHLEAGGALWVVVRKNQGAASLMAELERHYAAVQETARRSGYRLYCAR